MLDDRISEEATRKFEVFEDVFSTLRNCQYDHDAIDYDENGRVLEVKRRTPAAIERDLKCTCEDAAYYAFKKLSPHFKTYALSIMPFIGASRTSSGKIDVIPGIQHSICVYSSGNLFGFVDKSRKKGLDFSVGFCSSIDRLIFSKRFLKAYTELLESKSQEFLGLQYSVYDILRKFDEVDDELIYSDNCEYELDSKGLLFHHCIDFLHLALDDWE